MTIFKIYLYTKNLHSHKMFFREKKKEFTILKYAKKKLKNYAMTFIDVQLNLANFQNGEFT